MNRWRNRDGIRSLAVCAAVAGLLTPPLSAGLPTGGCRLCAGECSLETEVDCAILGGLYLGDGTSCAAEPGPWADTVLGFSSQYTDTVWSAAQALGPPDTFEYGDISTAWAPVPQNGTLEFISLGWSETLQATGVTIRETWGNGFVYRIDAVDLADVAHPVWRGTDPTPPGAPGELVVTWPATAFQAKGITIHVDTDHDRAHGRRSTPSGCTASGRTAMPTGRPTAATSRRARAPTPTATARPTSARRRVRGTATHRATDRPTCRICWRSSASSTPRRPPYAMAANPATTTATGAWTLRTC